MIYKYFSYFYLEILTDRELINTCSSASLLMTVEGLKLGGQPVTEFLTGIELSNKIQGSFCGA